MINFLFYKKRIIEQSFINTWPWHPFTHFCFHPCVKEKDEETETRREFFAWLAFEVNIELSGKSHMLQTPFNSFSTLCGILGVQIIISVTHDLELPSSRKTSANSTFFFSLYIKHYCMLTLFSFFLCKIFYFFFALYFFLLLFLHFILFASILFCFVHCRFLGDLVFYRP